MKRELRTTLDGSNTLYISSLNENYHSHHGALNEAKHVFIKNGLDLINNYKINILELGFGTGLNVLVTFDAFLENDKNCMINYYSLEKYPITNEEILALNYPSLFDKPEVKNSYLKIHTTEWNSLQEIAPNFNLMKIETDFLNLENIVLPSINLVYYDCFGARVQPDLWGKPLLKMVANTMAKNGLLTTYSSKGSVRRILQELGFNVEKKPGPLGKREMLNAVLLDKEN